MVNDNRQQWHIDLQHGRGEIQGHNLTDKDNLTSLICSLEPINNLKKKHTFNV